MAATLQRAASIYGNESGDISPLLQEEMPLKPRTNRRNTPVPARPYSLHLSIQSIFLGVILTLPVLPALTRAFVRSQAIANSEVDASTVLHPARFTGGVSVSFLDAGNPTINLSDGHRLLTSFAGQQQALEQNTARPLSLTAADFDEDGIPDLISGYGDSGRGIVTLLRGNVDAIYPNAPEAKQGRANG